MITIDAKATERLRILGTIETHPMMEAGRLSRIVGMDVVRLPDGREALGKPAYDGSWAVLVAEGGLSHGAPSLWRAGRVHQEEGLGLMAAAPCGLGEAFGAMILLPSPVRPDGAVVEAAFDDPDDAARAVEGGAAPRP